MQGGVRCLWCVVALVCAAACSSATDHGSTVSGVVRAYGGPAEIVHGKAQTALNGAPMRDQVVTVRRSDGSTLKVRTGGSGRFRLSLQPGRYTISPSCGTSVQVTVATSSPAALTLRCDFL
jgi:hypothetical protein